MSWNFKPGDKVVCIDDSHGKSETWRGANPIVGQIYTIQEVTTHIDRRLGLILVELKRHPIAIQKGFLGYGAYRFRPVRTTSIECFRQHLMNIPKVKELVK